MHLVLEELEPRLVPARPQAAPWPQLDLYFTTVSVRSTGAGTTGYDLVATTTWRNAD